jgi:hypothetical protein
MALELDFAKTAAVFLLIVVLGVGGLVAAPIPMGTDTIMMMVAPSMIVFGLIMVALGVKHGEYRATH